MSSSRAIENAKEAFARETDDVNRRSMNEGAGADAASDLAAILLEHERECAVLADTEAETGREGAAE